jgi:GPH family glycoside/pentoside/hexuronide:cation symporter
MNKINWSKRSDDPNSMLCVAERFGYALSNTGSAWTYILTVAFLTYYYTDVVGVPPAAIGTIFLLSRIFDGFSDMAMGWIIDKTRTKIGKARPWILIMAIPNAVCVALAFAVPESLVNMPQYIFIFVTYNLCTTVTYTMVNIPIWAANNLLTNNSQEHAKSGIWMQIGASVVLLIVQYTFLNLIDKFGGGRQAWTIAAAIYSGLGGIFVFVSGLLIRERVVPDAEEVKISITKRLGALFRNKYWVIFVFSWLLSGIQWTLIGSGALYYASHILNDIDKYSIIGPVQTFAMLLAMLVIMTWAIKKLKPVKVWVIGSAFMLVSSAIQLFITKYWGAIIVCEAIKGLGMAFQLGSQGALIADSVEYSKTKFGFDVSGVGNAGVNFGSKVGTALGGVIIGWVLAWYGYDGLAAVQTPSAIMGIKVVYLHLTIIFSAICMLLMIPFDLYKKIKWD